MASGPSQFVPNQVALNVAVPLRYVDANGNLVTQLYLIDYVSLIGSTTGQQVNQISAINGVLNNYQTTLTSLQNQITAINTSGATAIPQVNGYCLNGNLVQPINIITTLLVSNTCSYNTILGTPTALAQAIIAQPSGLNTLPAFSQSGTMSGLTGWISNPLTIAASENNQWVAYGDVRKGVSNALASITPTCSQVIVNFAAFMPSFYTGMNLYFDGYTFIPTGYTDGGSSIQVTDGMGGILVQSFNIVTASNTSGSLNLNTSGSTLSPTASVYTVQVTSIVSNAAIGLSCNKVTLQSVVGTGQGGGQTTSSCCPDIGTYSALYTSGTTAISLITGLAYKPRYVGLTGQDSYTVASFLSHGYYLTYIIGGCTLTFTSPPTVSGTPNINWIAFK